MNLRRLVFLMPLLVLAAASLRAPPALAAAAAPVAAKPGLTGHKATYQLRLVRTVSGESVRAARGTMIYTLSDRCDGYTIESDISMDLAYSDGNSQKVDQRYAAWEAKNGRYSSFSMQNREDGEATKSYRGTITLDADGSGTAVYESDKPTNYDLPPGTLLSTAHTLALLENAAAGNKFLSRHVIDGSFDRGPFLVTAVISRPRDGGAVIEKKGAPLTAGRFWPMNLAYFPTSSPSPTPEYELGMDLLSTGISRSMVQDFGAFSIGFELIDLEPVKPQC